MREIIQVQVGQAGNQIGTAFWDVILREHGLSKTGFVENVDDDSLSRANVFFNEVESRFIPRAILADLEPGVTDSIRSGSFGTLFNPASIITSQPGAGNNWGKGFYSEGSEIITEIMDQLQRSADHCETLSGFQLTHSLGGGTGSGLGSLISTKIKEEYPDTLTHSFSLLPSSTSDIITSPYNTLLSLAQLISDTNLTTLLHNDSLFKIHKTLLKTPNPSFKDLNHTISNLMSSASSSLRFPSILNASIRKLALNLTPFQRTHFLTPAYAPFVNRKCRVYEDLSIENMVGSVFQGNGVLCGNGFGFGKIMACAVMCRGECRSAAVESAIGKAGRGERFVKWIPDRTFVSYAKNERNEVGFLGNYTGIEKVLEEVVGKYGKLFDKKAFLFHYISEGMDESEFYEAEMNVRDLIQEYQQYQSPDFEELEENEEEDECEAEAEFKVACEEKQADCDLSIDDKSTCIDESHQ